MAPGDHLSAFLQNFASEYGRRFGGVGFASAMAEALNGFHNYLPGERANAAFIAQQVERIGKMFAEQKP
ncbi:MAG: hypothetical protein K2Q32_02955 [Alphaproteobacteria bacterium]|nr:hypothetical protein [Alphaproteobacteria bacterium]